MTQYILKRILIMVPTFLFITLLVFVVVNLAPGEPGQAASASGSEAADQSANQRESYRLFKEQYNLDKPILFNMRFRLGAQDVIDELEVVARNMSGTIPGETQALLVGRTAARVTSDVANRPFRALEERLADPALSEEARDALILEQQGIGFVTVEPIRPRRPRQGEVFRAEERLEDWGHEIVPHLLRIANELVYLVDAETANPWTAEGRGVFAGDLAEPPVAGQPVSLDGRQWVVHPVLTDKIRFIAGQRLSVNARRRVLVREGERASEEQRNANREVVRENNTIARWTWPLNATTEEREAVLGLWNGWWQDGAAQRYERAGMDYVRQFFLDTRFAAYWTNLAKLDLGTSIRYRRPVLDVVMEHLRYSIILSVLSLFFAYTISVPLGILAAVRQNGFADRGIGILLFVLYSLPSFFVATLAQTYLTRAGGWDLFPVSGFNNVDAAHVTTWELMWNTAWHLVLPVFCLTYTSLAVLSRYARTGLLDVIRSDYIRTARAKGLSEWVVIMKHAVRNGMIPILTLLGTTLPVLIGGSIIIEYIFVIEGMGHLMITSILFRDYNVIMGVLLLSSILTLIGILLSDISYALVDPRISFD